MKEIFASFVPRRSILSISLDDEQLLFNPTTQDFILLNPTSAIIWQGLCEGFSVKEIVGKLARATGLSDEKLSYDIAPIITQWTRLGLSGTQKAKFNKEMDGHSESPEKSIPIPDMAQVIVPEGRFRYAFTLADTSFVLSLDDESVYQSIREHTRQFSAPDIETPDIETADITFRLATHQDGYALIYADKVVDACNRREKIIPMLHASMMMAAYRRSNCMIGLHAASVTFWGHTILMPAPAGSGKSTLVAGLMNSGFRFGADDLVLLDETPGHIRPVPTSIGVKSGSWPVLEPLFPELGRNAIHLREDGRKIKYLVPEKKQLLKPSAGKPQVINCIVYPSYGTKEKNLIQPVTPAQSLVLLSKAGFDINRKLTEQNVTGLVEWIKQIPSFRLSFSQLDASVELLKKLGKAGCIRSSNGGLE